MDGLDEVWKTVRGDPMRFKEFLEATP